MKNFKYVVITVSIEGDSVRFFRTRRKAEAFRLACEAKVATFLRTSHSYVRVCPRGYSAEDIAVCEDLLLA